MRSADKRKELEEILRISERKESAHAQAILGASTEPRKSISAPMAIVGMSGRYPKSKTIDDFWENLINGRNCIEEIGGERLEDFVASGGSLGDESALKIKHFGLIEDIYRFEAPFFNISRREAEVMDPHMRLMLETVWSCIENAGYRPKSINPRTGVFASFYNYEYGEMLRELEIDASSEAYLGTATTGAILTNRISFLLGLTGPSEVYNTACSTALVAVHRAVQAIQAGDCDQAIVAGVSLLLTASRVIALSRMGILNEVGICNSFSHPANKEVIGEGVGAVMIKPLDRAVADGDFVYAVIRGSDVNHHGARSGSMTLPSSESLSELMTTTYRKLAIKSGKIRFIEGHGAGGETDVIELQAIQLFLEKAGHKGQKIPVSSVKSNIGFGEASGGMAQLTKATLSLSHGKIPATLNFEQTDPVFDVKRSLLEIHSENISFPDCQDGDCVSLLAYGLGGTNAHVVLNGYANRCVSSQAVSQDVFSMLFSAGSERALAEYIAAIVAHLRFESTLSRYRAVFRAESALLQALSRTLAGRERQMVCRVVFEVKTIDEFLDCCADFLAGKASGRITSAREIVTDEKNGSKRDFARRWASGESVSFETWIGSAKYQKLPLPTIPFKGDVYRLKKQQGMDRSKQLRIEERWVVKRQNADVVVEVPLAPNDCFISQHLVDGTSIMPGTGYIALLGQIARKVYSLDRCTIKNLAWTHPFETRANAATMRFEFEKSGRFRIYHKESETVCCTGKLLLDRMPTISEFEASFNASSLDGITAIADKNAYWTLANAPETRQFHGPDLRRLSALFYLDDRIVGVLDPMDTEPVLSEIAFYDSALGACRGFTFLERGKAEAVIPFAVEQIDLLNSIPAGRKIYASVKRRPGNLTRYDISIENGEGEIYAVLIGYHPKARSGLPRTLDSVIEQIPSSEPGRVRDFLMSEIQRRVAEFLKCDVSAVPLDESLEPLGLDSIGINTLTDQIGSALKFDMPATTLFEYTSIRDAIDYLISEFGTEMRTFVQGSAPVRVETKEGKVPPKPASIDNAIKKAIPLSKETNIAVVGMGGMFPGAANFHDFWNKIRTGRDLIVEMPEPRRKSVYRVYENLVADMGGIYGGFVDDADKFDAAFFGYGEEEVMAMDPQQRLFLEAAWSAIEDAGYSPLSLSSQRIGVYVGAIVNDYGAYLHDVGYPVSMFYEGTGSSLAGIANRVSYVLNLTGPSQGVDTACCSSLYAIDRAVNDIRQGACDAAIAGGVSFVCTESGYKMYSAMDYLSKDWRCKPFAEGGDGWSKAELFGAVFLKRLEDAVREGDPIYAVIKASGTNHGGKGYFYTQPNGSRHVELIREVYRKADVDPRAIVHIEAHGSGTEMGDALEFNSISKALKEFAQEKGVTLPLNSCGVGSIKSNIGHAEAGAGIAGFMKTVMLLREKCIPPSLHLETINKNIRWKQSPLYLVQSEQSLVERNGSPERAPHCAGVHSFNFSGAAAHVLVEEYIGNVENQSLGLTRYPICLSAKSAKALAAYCESMGRFLTSDLRPEISLDRLACTINSSRSQFDFRFGIIVESIEELVAKMMEAAAGAKNSGDLFDVVERKSNRSIDYPKLCDANVDVLLNRWRKESAFDWSVVLKGFEVQKLNLPTYPFEHLRSYFPQADALPLQKVEANAQNQSGAAAFSLSTPRFVEHSGSIEEQLTQILATILSVSVTEIEMDRNVSEYGFDSLKVVALSKALNDQFGLMTNPPELFEFATPSEMVVFIEATKNDSSRMQSSVQKSCVPAGIGVAIIGMSGQMPGASNLEEFWKNLLEGKNAITEIPADRWNWKSIEGDPHREQNKTNIRWGGFIDDVTTFDPLFFGISPREAELMDPQQRLLMMYVWRAVEDAGYAPFSLAGTNTGLFIGTGSSNYGSRGGADAGGIEGFTSTGAIPSLGPNRMSHFLDLNGPSEPVETSCSSSLVAIHRAVSSIASGECAVAIAGGINTIVTADDHISFSKAGMLSGDGRCKTFSTEANGYVRGEGVGILVLKPLELAEKDGDHIYGVIRSTAVNHGGRSNSLTAPNPKAQAELLKTAYSKAGVDPRTVGYIEAHGTGTPLGDPIEINALKIAFKALYEATGEAPISEPHCAIGAVKTNIGHLELAAGVAGVIKVLLQLQHKTLVTSLHCEKVNPFIDLNGSPFYLLTERRPWVAPLDPSGHTLPRRAGISSFGFGGVNAHVVIEEYLPSPNTELKSQLGGPYLILLSAKSECRLSDVVKDLDRFLAANPDISLADLAFTLQTGREAMDRRLALVTDSVDQLKGMLRVELEGHANAQGFYRGRVSRDGRNSSTLFVRADHKTARWAPVAEHWIRGGALDWADFYREAMPKRISSPTYPFARDRCWLEVSPIITKSAPIAESAQSIFLPDWSESEVPTSSGVIRNAGTVIIVESENSVNLGAAIYSYASDHFPAAKVIRVRIGDSTLNIGTDEWMCGRDDFDAFRSCLVACESVSSVFFVSGANSVGSDQPCLDELQLLRLTKALREKMSASDSVDCFVLTVDNFQLGDSAANPRGGGLTGLAYAIAQGDHRFRVRNLDLSLDDLQNSATADTLNAKIIAEPASNRGDVFKLQSDRRYRRTLSPFDWSNVDGGGGFRENGVYVILGGSGEVGSIVTQRLIRDYHATVVWIGRTSQQDANLRARIGLCGAPTGQLLYVQADALSEGSLRNAIDEVKKTCGSIHGALFAGAVFSFDNSIAGCAESEFIEILDIKTRGSLNFYQAFKNEALDFMCFFSSAQSFSFSGAANLSAYAAGITFTDSFVHSLIHSSVFPVGCVNWGFWESKRQAPSAARNFGVLDPRTGFQCLERFVALLQKRVLHQVVCLNASESVGGMMPIGPDYVVLAHGATRRIPGVGRFTESSKKCALPDIAGGNEFDAWMLKLLYAQIRELDHLEGGERVAPAFEKWLRESKRVVGQNQFADPSQGNSSEVWAAWEDAKAGLIKHAHLKPQIELAEVCLQELPAILHGTVRATDILFPGGSMERVERIYKGSGQFDFFGEIVADSVHSYVEQRLASNPNYRFRILEIGAGTGGTTAKILERLRSFESNLEEYSYTDISQSFLLHGEAEFAARGQFLKFKLLDIEQAPNSYGIDLGSYDLVIAANVLHATRDIRRTVRHAKSLLKRNGQLILDEIAGPSIFAHLTFGLLPGWWLFEDEHLRISGNPGLYPNTWTRLLREEGFLSVSFPAEDAHFLSQQVVIAESNGLIRLQKLINRAPDPGKTLSEPRMANSSVKQNSDSDEAIKRPILRVLSKLLKIPETQFESDVPFSEYGVDSILGVSFVNRLSDELGVSLNSAILFDYTTIGSLTAYISGSLSQCAIKMGQSSVPSKEGIEKPNAALRPIQNGPSSTFDGIAVIGMSGQFPGANDVDAFWQNLIDGKDGVRELPAHYLDEETGNQSACTWGGILQDRACFDPLFFKITPREAESMNPHQRLILQESWKALEDAAIRPGSLEGKPVGLFIGAEPSGYEHESFTGASDAIIASRLSYFLNLKGPALVVNTGCSSSAAAIHLACQSLRYGESSLALAGGVFATMHQKMLTRLSSMDMLSPSGCCHSFDVAADGTVFSEGVGVVVLKRYQDALADGDLIYGVIQASGMNQDGASNGITAPNGEAQKALICDLYRRFKINPESVTYVEAHGTGTNLGDPIEANALVRAFREFTAKEHFCAIGSVKSSIGHASAAAGVISLIKILLMMRHEKIPKAHHFNSLNPLIEFDHSAFFVNTILKEWPTIQGCVRVAALNSFGHSGTNVHLVIRSEDAPVPIRTGDSPCLILLSAKNGKRLKETVGRLVSFLDKSPSASLESIACTLQIGRDAMKERVGFIAGSLSDLRAKLEGWLAGHSGDWSFRGVIDSQDRLAQIFKADEDSHAMLTRWLEHRKLDKLAELWTLGVAIDWQLLYSGAKPPKVRLPGYPFAKEQYWASQGAPRPVIPVKTSSIVQNEDSEILCFEEVWERQVMAPPSGVAMNNRVLTCICLLSDPGNQASIREAMRESNPNLRIFFLSREEIGWPGFKRIQEEVGTVDVVLYLCPLEDHTLIRDLAPTVSMIQAIESSGLKPKSLVLAGEFKDGLERCYLDSWIGFERSLPLVMAGTNTVVLLAEGKAADSDQLRNWSNRICQTLALERPSSTLYSGGFAYALKVHRVALATFESVNLDGKAVLITGGCGGLGLAIARHLAGRSKINFVLTGRSRLDERIESNLESLRALGSTACYVPADVNDLGAMERGLNRVRELLGAIHIVIHAAGFKDERTIFERENSAIQSVLAPKINGTLVLDHLLAKDPLELVCYFSSSSAVLGDFGACDYAIGNRFQVAYSETRNSLVAEGKLAGRTQVICWPLWDGIGMGQESNEATSFFLKSTGQRALKIDEGLSLFEKLLSQKKTQHLVLAGNAEQLQRLPGFDREKAKEFDSVAKEVNTEDLLRGDLREKLSSQFKLSPERLVEKQNFADFGVDSVGLADFARTLAAYYGMEFTPSDFFGHSTLESLRGFFMSRHAAHIERFYRTKSEIKNSPEVVTHSTQSAIESEPSSSSEPIAIIGMSGRFPNARNAEEMWQILAEGRTAIRGIPADRFDLCRAGEQSVQEEIGTDSIWCGTIPGAAEFDPLFFEISPLEAESMDPRQRLLLQESWKALEDAGFGPVHLSKQKIGMFVGVEDGDYQYRLKEGSITSNHTGILASRLAYFLDLKGPVMAINTSCSSSLVAAHQACQSLRNRECDAVIVAGVSLTLTVETYAAMNEAGMLSPNGKCCAFDKRASGMVPGEAVVALVLKRLSQAVKDKDPIHGVIVGSGVNYDGKTNGITAPSGVAQSELLKSIYETHRINPREVEYVVTHGTGTRLGDPVEINALAEVFGQYSETGIQGALTSCKPNFGHTFAASGLVNLVSLIQSLKHEIIPASINFEDRNDYIRWDDRFFHVNLKNKIWPMRIGRPRIGAVSAFGMSGTNAHMIVRDHLEPEAVQSERVAPFLIVLSARTKEVLGEQIQQLILDLEGRSPNETDLLNVSYTLLVGRHHFSHRCAVVAGDIQGAIEALNARPGANYSSGIVGSRFTPNKESQNQVAELISNCGNSTKSYQNRETFLHSIARYYCEGYDSDWSNLFVGTQVKRLHLPTYPFSRNRYWVALPGSILRATEDSGISCLEELKASLRLPAFEETAIQSLLESQSTVMDRPMIELLSATLASLDLLQEGSKNLTDIASGRPASQYLERWLKAGRMHLRESSVREGVSGNLAELWKKWDRTLVKEVIDHDLKARFALAEVCLRALPEILRGERRPVDVIFPNSSMALLEPIYRHDRIADLFNQGVAGCVVAYFKQRIAHDPSSRIRILEIGAGMGATTSAVLPRLNPFKENLAEYCYTDLSKAFLIHAEERFVPDYPCVVPKIFDVTKPITDQNIEGQRYDLVIAANVLHATPDIRLAVKNAKAVLRKHGVLMLYEFSDGGLFPHLAFGLLEGWWLYEDEELRIPGCPGLLPETWNRVLEEEGFGSIIFPAANGHGLGQQLIMAESDGIVRNDIVEKRKEVLTVEELPDAKAATEANDSDLRKKSVSYFKKLMEAALKMGTQEIDPDEPLESYGMDSLMIGKVLNKLREEFKHVPSTLLFEIQTVNALSNHFITNRRSEMLNRLGMKSAEHFREKSSPEKEVVLPNIVSPPLPEARPHDEPIVIIGLSGHYPSAPNLQTFWENIKSGKDCITEIPPERWSLGGFFNPNKEEAIDSGMSYCKWGAFLEGFNLFDPLFFNIAPREALHMDPQERLFLQAAWEVIEDAGYTRASLAERFDRKVGVFTGITHTDYNIFGPDQWRNGNWVYPRTSFASVPNRVSFLFNLEGPSMPVDTMCSSSLTAIHEACESIKRGECVMAIAGAVNLCLHPSSYVGLSAARMLSAGPKCHSFGVGDDGFVSGEGVGAVLLKRLSDAIRDKDQIYGVIRGTAVNHGGRTNGYTVPNPQAQGKVVREALNRAGINARTVTCIEAHGTGTKLGDPIEVAGLTRAFQHDTLDTGFCSLGSVKSNVGHLEAAAGLAGLTKVILQMKHGQLAPSLHSEQLNPEIDFPKTPFIVQQKISEWKRPEIIVDGKSTTFPRIAGISSFGAGGSNAHVIVEEFQQARPVYGPGADSCLIVLSARNETRLYEQASQLLEFIRSRQNLKLADIAFTLQIGREAMEERIGLLANSKEEVEQSLRAFLDRKTGIARFYRREASSRKYTTPSFLDDREVRLMICKWLTGKKFGKLLDLWVHGYTVDWKLLYQSGEPNRISLPTYPFAKEQYWLSEPGQSQRSENSRGRAQTEPHLGTTWLFAREEWQTKPIPNDLDWKAQLKRFEGRRIAIASANSGEALALMELIRQLETAANLPSPLEINTLVLDETLDGKKAPDVILFIGPQYRRSPGLEPSEDDISLVYQLSQKLMNAFWDEPIQIYYLYESDSSCPRLDCQALSGFIRAAMRENEQHIWKLIQHTGSRAARFQALLKEWLSSSQFSEELVRDIEIRLEGEVRHVKALVETGLEHANAGPFKQGGVYLIAGGMGYLGKELSEQLAVRHRSTLVIFSQGTLDESRQAQCRKLEALGAKVIYESVDITDRTRLTDAYRRIRKQTGPINGVFHLARRHEDQMIAKKPWSSFWRVIHPKVQGALLLDELTKDEHLDFFVLFSSLGAYGVRGSCDYSYSTAFQNAFSAFRNQEVKEGKRFGSTIAICWGPWMEDHLFPESRAKLTKGGFGLIDMKAGFSTMEQGICAGISPLSMTLIRDGDRVRKMFGINPSKGKATESNLQNNLELLLTEWENRKSRGEDISEAMAERIDAATAEDLEESHVLRVSRLLFGGDGQKGSIEPPALELAPGRLKLDSVDEIAAIIRDLVIKVLSLEGIDDDRAFQDYGLDSISGMQLAVRLEKRLKREVLPQWFINFPTVATLSQRIMEERLSNQRN